MCSLCVLKYTKGAVLTASSLLGNLFKDIFFVSVCVCVCVGRGGGGGDWGAGEKS